jgi:hypothetical protein
MSHLMSQTSVSLPIQFVYRTVDRWRWRIREDGSLTGKNLRMWPSPVILERASDIDPWEMRGEFLEIPNSEKSLLEYLNRTGYWNEHSPRSIHDYWSWQDLIRKALLRRQTGWSKLETEFGPQKVDRLKTPLEIRIQWDGKRFVGEIKEWSPLDAILATVWIDKMTEAKFGLCARPDCRKIYPIKTRHKRKYCTQYCAHLEDVRRDRRQQSKGERTANKKENSGRLRAR